MKKLFFLLLIVCINTQLFSVPLEKQLFKAIKKGNLVEVKQLINAGAEVNALNRKGFSPLHIAVASNHVPIMETLVEHGADLFYQCEVCCNVTLLSIAAFNRAYAAAEYLLANGLNVNGAELQCETPLQSATSYDDIKMMKILLAHGADVNRLDSYGDNALSYTGSKPAFDLLYKAGINLHVIDDKGYSILIYFWHQKLIGINEILCTLFYEGVVYHEPDKDHHLYLNKNFHLPAGFDSLIILDNVFFILELQQWHSKSDTFNFVLKNNDTLTLTGPGEYYFGINGGIPNDFEIGKDEDVLSIFISHNAKDKEKYNGLNGKYILPHELKKENAWAHIKYKGLNYYAQKNENAGYVLLDEKHCNRVKFFNLLLENPDSGKKIRIYGENSCLNE